MKSQIRSAGPAISLAVILLAQFGCSGQVETPSPDATAEDIITLSDIAGRGDRVANEIVGNTDALVTPETDALGDLAGATETSGIADSELSPDTPEGSDSKDVDVPEVDVPVVDVPEGPPPPKFGPPTPDQVTTPSIEGPITSGNGNAVLLPPTFDLASVGYIEEEFFISGEATSYVSYWPLTEDGYWEVEPSVSKPYTTRVIVRRPAKTEDFGGVVLVEWLNVSAGMDAAPDWTFMHVQMIRKGTVWVGLSAQIDGIEGDGSSLGALFALKNVDPVRYGPLEHPGDDYSYDIFSQAGAAVWFGADKLLGGLEPEVVLALGESQSAIRLTSYINAVAPIVDVYDGYLVHSRAGFGAPLIGEESTPDPTYLRTDLEIPVLVLSTETDLVDHLLGYHRARQEDGPWFAGWEIAGAAHLDSYTLGLGDEDDGSGSADQALFESMLDPPSSVYFGVLECDNPINTGPQTYVARAALAALIGWASHSIVPPGMPQLQLDESGEDFLRDGVGNALGGIRTPQVDAPVARLSGLGETGWNFCTLFGSTMPLTKEELADRYPDQEIFIEEWNLAVDVALEAGAILAHDAAVLEEVGASFSF
jgi:hypothetical protein